MIKIHTIKQFCRNFYQAGLFQRTETFGPVEISPNVQKRGVRTPTTVGPGPGGGKALQGTGDPTAGVSKVGAAREDAFFYRQQKELLDKMKQKMKNKETNPSEGPKQDE